MKKLCSFAFLPRRPLLIALLISAVPVLAQDKGEFEAGRKLMTDNKCDTCHISKFGGDGSAMFTRKERRVTSWPKLKTQVARCNTELNVGLFPEDEEQIAAYLNAAHYKFKKAP